MARDDMYQAAISLAVRQGGVVTSKQLAAIGLTRGQVDGFVRRRGWRRVGSGAFRILPARDHRDRVLAAVAALERAVVSHETAAELHGITRVPRGMSVVTVHSRTTHVFEGVDVHRTHDLDWSHVVEFDGLPVTAIERTVVDLAAHRSPSHLGAIVDDLVAAGRVDLESLAETASSIARKGKPGTRTMRRVLEDRAGEARPQSELERRARTLLREAGLPAPVSEYPIPWAPNRRFDDAYPVHRLAIEWDSRRYHGQLEAFEADRRRDRDATVHGWRVLRFTWQDVEQRPAMVVGTVRTLLAEAA